MGYFGGLSKHKGAHILVEACADLPGVALELHGDSSDRPYVEGLRARCREVGVRWRGAYAAGQLAERLAGVDLVCVPSLWLENAPFVIREAFAAGRPVLASHLGALPESVRDGVDGRLLPAGDVAAWRTALAELAAEPERLAALARGVRPPRELDDLAAELLDSYTLLCEREPQPARELPEHLATFQARRTALAGEPFADLLERVRNDVARLRGRLGLPPGPGSGDALASARARDLLRDERAALAWQRQVTADDRAAREHLQAEARCLRDLQQQREREIEAAGQECSQLESARSAEEAERDWLREILAALERERDWLREQLAELQRERDEHAALRAHERWLSAEAQRLLAALGALDEQQPQAGDHTALARALAQAPERAASLLAELAWRRVQMEQA